METTKWIMPDNSMDNDSRDSICQGDIIEFDAEKLVPDPIKETLCFITYLETGATNCRMAVAGYGAVSLRPLNPNEKPYLMRGRDVILHKVINTTRLMSTY